MKLIMILFTVLRINEKNNNICLACMEHVWSLSTVSLGEQVDCKRPCIFFKVGTTRNKSLPDFDNTRQSREVLRILLLKKSFGNHKRVGLLFNDKQVISGQQFSLFN